MSKTKNKSNRLIAINLVLFRIEAMTLLGVPRGVQSRFDDSDGRVPNEVIHSTNIAIALIERAVLKDDLQ